MNRWSGQWLANTCLHWLSPQQCRLCELPAAAALCEGCCTDLSNSPARCRQCGVAMPDSGVCGQCLQSPPSYQTVVCGFDYAFPLDVLLSRLKYDADLTVLPAMTVLVAAMADQLTAASGSLVPVPLHPRRERQRGFNQSLLMARALAAHSELRLADRLLVRALDTPPQAELSATARQRNMSGAFVASGDVAGIRVWLLDDVVTTGATMEAAARALLDGGALSVNAIALMRSVG